MKSRIYLLIAVILFLSGNAILRAQSLLIATCEWEPYISEKMKHYGVISHIVSHAFQNEGISVRFEFYPWKRGLLYTKSGKADAASVWSSVPGREKDFYYSDVVYEGKLCWAYRKGFDFPKMETMNFYDSTYDIAKLKGFRIGGVRGDDYGVLTERGEQNGIALEFANDAGTNVNKLLLNRLDLIIISPERLNMYKNSPDIRRTFTVQEVDTIVIHPEPIRISRYYLLFPKCLKRSNLLRDRFNHGLLELKKAGTYKKYLLDHENGLYYR